MRDYLTKPRTAMRRRDRAVDDDAWIERLLDVAPVAAIATSADGQPFINTNIFLYDRTRRAIYLHTASEGRLRANAGADGRCCLSVFTMGRILPAEKARNFSVEYESVMVFGRIVVVEDREERVEMLHALNAKYAPHLLVGRDYTPVDEADLRDTTLFRIDVEEWTGKRKSAPEDAPGAFLYESIAGGDARREAP